MAHIMKFERRLSSELFVLIVMVSLAFYIPLLFGDEVPDTGSVLFFGAGWAILRVASISVGEVWRRKRSAPVKR